MLVPQTETQMAEAIRSATGPLSLRGGATRGGWGGGEVLSTRGLTGITLYEPEALTMVARAGTPLAEVTATLAAAGQHLPFEPPVAGLLSGPESTIGGVFAADASGPRRMLSGAARDYLLGIRAVDGHGRIFANGGRVMKNVTGLDLVRLFAGSEGRLGVMTEVAFKVLPRPQVVRTLIYTGLTITEATALMIRAARSDCEVSAAVHLDEGQLSRTALRLEGTAAATAERAARLSALLPATGAEVPVFDWAAVADLTAWQGRAGALWRMMLKPSDAPAVWQALRALAPLGHLRADWGGGVIWALLPEGTDPRAGLGPLAQASCLRLADGMPCAPSCHPPRHPVPAAGVARLEEGLLQAFDPHGLFRGGF